MYVLMGMGCLDSHLKIVVIIIFGYTRLRFCVCEPLCVCQTQILGNKHKLGRKSAHLAEFDSADQYQSYLFELATSLLLLGAVKSATDLTASVLVGGFHFVLPIDLPLRVCFTTS